MLRRMPDADRYTRPVYRRIALVFDFDQTLAGDSVEALLDHVGVDRDEFVETRLKPKKDDGWDPIAARFQSLIEVSRERKDGPITREMLGEVGRRLGTFDGVPEMFGRVREAACDVAGDVEVEFHVCSSGIAEIIRGTPVYDEFASVAAGEFAYDADGGIAAAKRIVSHVEKTRYCHAIAVGHTPIEDITTRPVDLHSPLDDDDVRVPFRQMVYAGDGSSDVPVFSLMNARGGLAIGVRPSGGKAWKAGEDIRAGRRVLNLAPPDYTENGEMLRSLKLAVGAICHRVALSALSAGE